MAKKKTAPKKDPRGRRAGQKVGPYKKTLKKDDNKQTVGKTEPKIQKIEETEAPKNDTSNSDHSNNHDTTNGSSNNTEPPVSDEKQFADFVQENGSPDEYKDVPPQKIDDQVEQKQDDYKEVKKDLTPSVKKLINGRTLLAFCDAIIPGLLMKLLQLIDKEMKDIKGRDIKLTLEQKEDMREVADAVAAMIFDKVDPLTLFFIMLFVNYYANAQIKAMEKINIPITIVEEEKEAA